MAASALSSRLNSATPASWLRSRKCYRTRDSRYASMLTATSLPVLIILCSRSQNRELQIMRRLEHCNIVKLKYFFYSSGEKVSEVLLVTHPIHQLSFSSFSWMFRDDFVHKFYHFFFLSSKFFFRYFSQKTKKKTIFFVLFFFHFRLFLSSDQLGFFHVLKIDKKKRKTIIKLATRHAPRRGLRNFCWSAAGSGQDMQFKLKLCF